MIKILLLAANPKDSSPLQLNQEIREIDREITHAKFGAQFKFEYKVAVRLSDLLEYLEEVQPDIVHFSGHGNTTSGIILEDDVGNSRPISKESIKEIFSLLKGKIRCIVLNACYSEAQANALAEDIDCVVGMLGSIDDQAALEFSREFYRQLANGKDVATALKLARTYIADEQDLVRLLAFKANPSKVIFVKKRTWIQYLIGAIVAIFMSVLFMYVVSTYWPTAGGTPIGIIPFSQPQIATRSLDSIACIYISDPSGVLSVGTSPKVTAESLKYYRYDGDQSDNGADANGKPQLPINGQKILFTAMKSFTAVKRDELEGVTVSITLTDGSLITGLVAGSKFDSRLRGVTVEGTSFDNNFMDIYQVDFQEQNRCP